MKKLLSAFGSLSLEMFPVCRDSVGQVSRRRTLHSHLNILLLIALAGAIPCSNYLMSACEVLLFANWVLEWNMKEKFSKPLHHLLRFALLLMGMHFLGLLYSHNLPYGINDIFKKLPLLALPLVILTQKPLRKFQLHGLFFVYVCTVWVVTIIGFIRYLTIPGLPYREIVPFISHIRFALNVVMALCITSTSILWSWKHCTAPSSRMLSCGTMLLMMAWMLYFLLLQRSYTAFVALSLVMIVSLVLNWKKIPGRWEKTLLAVLLAAVISGVGILIGIHCHQYYHLSPLSSKPLKELTANQNPYTHKQDGLIENGNYVNNYICRKELQQEWNLRSSMDVDSTTRNGYSIYTTLIRYLNGKGLTKDSLGVSQLSPSDISSIEEGIANPVYSQGGRVKEMVFVMLFEWECYRHFHAVKDFTMLQRFELWKTTLKVWKQHPIIGTGTGDIVDLLHQQLCKDDSELCGTSKHSHNQYLSFLATFGIVGFLVLLAAGIRALRMERRRWNTLFWAYLTIVLVSFLTEDTLETLAGCLFSTYFLCLMGNTLPQENPNAINEPHKTISL